MAERMLTISEMFRRVFTLDLRSLAVLRMALGAVALLDIFYYRWPHAELLLSDRGVLPRELFARIYDASYWSLYRLSGDPTFVFLLLLLQAVAALAVGLGYRTRWATGILLVLCWSVQARNPLTNTGGDVLLRNLLAWSCLLPMGARWSWDASKELRAGAGLLIGNSGSDGWCSLATVGLVLQLVVMYFFAGLAKWNPDWLRGEALAHCLQLELYLKPPGYLLLEWPSLLPIITWATLAIELAAPVFLLTPWKTVPCRLALLACYWSFHFGIGMVYSIGIFSVVASASWLMFLPGGFWDRWNESAVRQQTHQRRESRESEEEWQGWLNWLAGAMLVFMLLINVVNALPRGTAPGMSRGLHELGRWTAFVQEYTMFGEPPKENPFYVVAAELRDGSQVDLFSGTAPNFAPTREEVFRWGKAQPWRRLWTNLSPAPTQELSEAGQQAFGWLHTRLLGALVEDWERRHQPGEGVRSAELLYFYRPSAPGKAAQVPQRIVWASWPAAEPSAGGHSEPGEQGQQGN